MRRVRQRASRQPTAAAPPGRLGSGAPRVDRQLVSSFFDSVGEFFSNLARVHWLTLLLGLVFFGYLSLRARVVPHPARGLSRRDVPVAPDLGRVLGRLRLQQRRARARRRRHEAVPDQDVDPGLELPGARSSFIVELIYDCTIAIPVLTFAFTQGVFPKPPDFSKLHAFDLASSPRTRRSRCSGSRCSASRVFAGFALLSARVARVLGSASARARDPQGPAPLLPRGLARPVRRLAVSLHRVLVPARRVRRRRLGQERAARARRQRRRGGRAVHARRRRRPAGAAGQGVRGTATARWWPPTRSASRSPSARSRSPSASSPSSPSSSSAPSRK